MIRARGSGSTSTWQWHSGKHGDNHIPLTSPPRSPHRYSSSVTTATNEQAAAVSKTEEAGGGGQDGKEEGGGEGGGEGGSEGGSGGGSGGGGVAAAATDGGWNGETPFPFIQGTDCCGVVVAVSDDCYDQTNYPGALTDAMTSLVGERVLVRACMRTSEKGFASYDTQWLGSDFDGAFAQYVVA